MQTALMTPEIASCLQGPIQLALQCNAAGHDKGYQLTILLHCRLHCVCNLTKSHFIRLDCRLTLARKCLFLCRPRWTTSSLSMPM